MNEYGRLRKEFDGKVVELQKACPHVRSEWVDEWWEDLQ
jgi:hypothetical protein